MQVWWIQYGSLFNVIVAVFSLAIILVFVIIQTVPLPLLGLTSTLTMVFFIYLSTTNLLCDSCQRRIRPVLGLRPYLAFQNRLCPRSNRLVRARIVAT